MKVKHILVIRLSAMGDVAMTVPVIKTLLNQHPNTKITFVSKGFLKPLFNDIENVNFYPVDVNGIHKGVTGIYKLHQELSRLNIDYVADLHNVLRSKMLRLFFKTRNIPVSFIDKGRAEKKALTALKNKQFKPLKTTHQRYAEVFKKLGFSVDLSQAVLKNKTPLNAELKKLINYKNGEKLIGIAPFAAHEGKKYPLDLMQLVVKELCKHYKVLLFGGGATEITLLTELAQTHPNSINLAGKIKLNNELIVISNLAAMVSMDSGNGHFSAMYGVPTISIWGATHPYAGFAPFLQTEHCICADRNKYPLLPTSIYGNKTIPGYKNVMHSITPQTIINKVLSIVN